MKKGLLFVLIAILVLVPASLAWGDDLLNYEADPQVRLDENGKGSFNIKIEGGAQTYASVGYYMTFAGGTIEAVTFSQEGADISVFAPKHPTGSNANPDEWVFSIMSALGNHLQGDLICTVEIDYTGTSKTTLDITSIERTRVGVGAVSTIVAKNENTTTVEILPHGSNTGGSVTPDPGEVVADDYQINRSQPPYGTISAPVTATEGSTVNISIEVDSGATFVAWEVINESTGDIVDVASRTAKNTSFIMPSSNVTIYAEMRGPDSNTDGSGSDTDSDPGAAIPDSGTPLSTTRFTDVPSSHWAYPNIEYLAERQFVTGRTATTFAPEASITRAEFITILARMSGETLPAYANTFTDVAGDAYYAQAVAWGVQAGVTTGTTTTTFSPNNLIKRQEISAMLTRYAAYKEYEFVAVNAVVTFADSAQISAYAQEPVSTMQQAGIINGYPDNTFRPNGNATRAEASKMLALTHELMNP